MQSNVIFGFIVVAFLFFITARGELATYLTILRGGGQQASSGSSINTSSASNITSAISESGSLGDIMSNQGATGILSQALKL